MTALLDWGWPLGLQQPHHKRVDRGGRGFFGGAGWVSRAGNLDLVWVVASFVAQLADQH